MKMVAMGMTVHASDGTAGRVDDVLVSTSTGQPAYVVINAGGLFASDVVVSYDAVRNVDNAGLWLALTRDAVTHAPPYDPTRHGGSAGFVSHAALHFGDED